MMRKLISALILLSLLLSVSVSAFAVDPDAPWVVDNADLLRSDEVAELNRQIQDLRSQLQLDIVIVTTYGTGYKNIQEYADDFYDRNGYGYGSSYSGILLLLDMEAREWYMSTCGDAIYIFTDYGLEQLGNEILPWLSTGAYYQAFTTWLVSLPRYVDAYRMGSPIDGFAQPDGYESDYGEEIVYYGNDGVGNPLLIGLIVGFIAALITILIMRSRMNTAKLQKGASDYLKDGSFHLRQRSDMFLYSRVTKKARPQNTSSHSGGSSVHRSSGGVHHGGRGGRF